MMPRCSTLTGYALFEGGAVPSRVRVFFRKPIKDRRFQLWLLVYFGYRRGNYIIWRGSAIVGLDVDSRDWLQLVHSCGKSKVERRGPRAVLFWYDKDGKTFWGWG
jgi:hypothetical protein